LDYWSEDALRKFLAGTLELILDFCDETITLITHDLKTRPKSWHQRDSAKTLKRKTQNFKRLLSAQLKVIPHLDRDQLLTKIYNLILMCERLSTLPGFGMSNQFGDNLVGNPEKQLLRRK